MNTSLIFIVSTQRSGSTWLQSLLSSYSGVVTAQETGCFSNYLSFLDRQWSFEFSKYEERNVGLSNLLSREEFIDLCRNFSDDILLKISDLSGVASPDYILEKTPHNALVIDLILEIYPSASIIHLVRDPRSVCASLHAASKGWGKIWAPSNSISSSRLWMRSNAKVASASPNNFLRVFYEDLRRDTEKEMKKVFDWLGLEVGCKEIEKIVEINEFEKLKKTQKTNFNDSTEPEGFFRSGKIDGWRSELTRSDIRVVEYICKDLMREFGYQFSGDENKKPLRLIVREAFEAVDWRIKKLTKCIVSSI